MNEILSEIVNRIQHMSGTYTPYVIFTDWVKMTALSISNSCQLFHDEVWGDRERQYIELARRYDEKQLSEIVNIGKLLIDFYEQQGPYDALGEIYMAAGCGSKATGQFFTPFHVAVLTASAMQYSDNEVITINEPSCGGGGMILAAAKVLADRGWNYQRCMRVTAQDIDWNSIYMTYVQLSWCGMNAVCIQGNTLTGDKPDKMNIFRTPRNTGVIM